MVMAPDDSIDTELIHEIFLGVEADILVNVENAIAITLYHGPCPDHCLGVIPLVERFQ